MMRMTMVMIMVVINARCGCILQNTLVANGARPLEPSHRASRCNEGHPRWLGGRDDDQHMMRWGDG